MGPPSAGQVVLVRFPFSDLSQTKLRPAVCLANVGRQDAILCQVTSKRYGDPDALPLSSGEFASGSLSIDSFVRPGKLFTAHQSLSERNIGMLTSTALERIIDAVVRLLKSGS